MTFNNIKTKDVAVVKKQKALKLVGTDGNAFALMGRAQAFNRANQIYSKEDLKIIMDECMSADYDHLLITLMHFFNVK